MNLLANEHLILSRTLLGDERHWQQSLVIDLKTLNLQVKEPSNGQCLFLRDQKKFR